MQYIQDVKSSMAEVNSRRERLAELLRKEGYLSVGALSQRFAVSEATVRRDLSALEKESRITRTYGGALTEFDDLFMPFHQRNAQNRAAKQRIAQKAASMVRPGQTVFMDAGSTVYAVAEKLLDSGCDSVRVVTNSLPVAEAVASRGTSVVHLLGGRLLPHQLVVVGSGSSVSLSSWRFDLAFLSAEGMNVEGLWNSQDDINDFQRHVCGRSALAVFCVDGSKLGRSAPSFLMPWQDVQQLITTAEAEAFSRLGTRLGPNRVSFV